MTGEPLPLGDEIVRAIQDAAYESDWSAQRHADAVLGVLTTRGEAFVRAHPNASAGALLRHLVLGVAPATPPPQDSAAACPPTRHGSVSVVGKPVALEASGVQTGDGPGGGAAADQLGVAPTPEPPSQWNVLRRSGSLPTHDQEQPR